MKIVHLPSIFFPSIGGAQVVAHNIAQQQYEAGHDVYLITGNTRDKKVLKDLKNNLPYTLLPLYSRSIPLVKKFQKIRIDISWIVGKQLSHYQKRYNFDVWHLHMIGPLAIMAFPYIKKMNVPIIATCHGNDIQKLPEINYGWRLNADYEKNLRQILFQCDSGNRITLK